ncbi:MFS transporter [Nonomuraea candida]|uniref:MFS transporter n=1 Tax=Nonomuraea candida TaxID=359159 RepID=UPI0005BA7CEE|nr:MFS transporter [Nonomuraea candida]
MTRIREALPGLFALATAGFLTMLTETIPAGLLPGIAGGLAVSHAQAGQLLTVYALGSVVAAIPLTALTRGLPRRGLLVGTVVAVALVNLLTAASASYPLTLAARGVAGMAAGVQWAMIAGYAMRLVDAPLKGRALAVSMAGVPTALALGIPAGAFAGGLLGWRATFAVMGVLALLAAGWVRVAVPPFPGERAGARPSARRVLLLPGLAAILAAALLFEVGHMGVYTYIAPFLEQAGLGGQVGPVLLAFGVAAMAGLMAAGAFVDRSLRAVALGTLALFAACMAGLGLLPAAPGPVVVITMLWGFALGLAPTLFQAASVRAAGSAADLAQAMVVTVLNAGMSLGSMAGGVLLGLRGVTALPWMSLAVFGAALLIAAAARRHAFPAPGRRLVGGSRERPTAVR